MLTNYVYFTAKEEKNVMEINWENLRIREFSSCSIPFLNLPAIVIYIMYVCLVILCSWFAVNLSKQGYSALDGYLKISLSKIKS